jgi:hypothetical protein
MPKNTLDDHLTAEPIDDISTIRKKLKYWSVFLFVIYGILNVFIVYYVELHNPFRDLNIVMWLLVLYINVCLPAFTFYLNALFVKMGVIPKELNPFSREEYPLNNTSNYFMFLFMFALLFPISSFMLGSIMFMFLEFILSVGSELFFDQFISFKDNDLIMESGTKVFILMLLTSIQYSSSIEEIENS